METLHNNSLLRMPKWKLALAGLGALYLVGFLVWGVYAFATSDAQQGATELAANPERQDEILARRRADEARKRLGLSAEQTDQLAALIEKHTRKARAARAESADDFESRRATMMALREEMEQELDTLLTPEQRETLASLPMPERGRLFGRGFLGGPSEGMRRGGPRPEGGPGWGDGPRGPRPGGRPGWGDGPRGPGPEGGAGWGRGDGSRPEGGQPRGFRGDGPRDGRARQGDNTFDAAD